MQVQFILTVDTNNIQACQDYLITLLRDLKTPHTPLALELYHLPNILSEIKNQVQPIKNLISIIDRSKLLGDDERLQLFKTDLHQSRLVVNNLLNL